MIEQDSDYALLTEIAVAYYDQEQTQEEIAKRFGISRIKVGRLLKKRARKGLLRSASNTIRSSAPRLSSSLFRTLALSALIALDHHDEDEQRQQVAALVSNYLAGVLKTI